MMTHNPSSETLRIWLLEDHEAFRRNLIRLFQHTQDIRIEHTFTTAEAMLAHLDSTDGEPPQALLLDIGLPGMSGLEIIRDVLRRAPGCRIVILTIFEDEGKITRALTQGACGYILKTAQPQEITAAIREAVAGGYPMSPHVSRSLVHLLTRLAPPVAPVAPAVVDELNLTPREQEMLRCLVDGLSNKSIATKMKLSPHTVDGYLRTLFGKLGVHSRAAAVARAMKDRLI